MARPAPLRRARRALWRHNIPCAIARLPGARGFFLGRGKLIALPRAAAKNQQ